MAIALAALTALSAQPASAAYSYYWYADNQKVAHKIRIWSPQYTLTRTKTQSSTGNTGLIWAQTLNAGTASGSNYAVEVTHSAINSKSASWWSVNTGEPNPPSSIKNGLDGLSYRNSGSGGMRAPVEVEGVELPELLPSDVASSLVPGTVDFLGEDSGTSYWEAQDATGLRLLISELPSGITGISYAKTEDEVIALRVDSDTDDTEVSEAYLLTDAPEVKSSTAAATVLGGRLIVVDDSAPESITLAPTVSTAGRGSAAAAEVRSIQRLWGQN
ncbi:hypothetical protein NSA53_03925 [Cellulosimicrobium cellulans]|uniref:hypothetical protein n=1 Tax=Cellulosimicrobium cellulans TaxID=1710 RepID=UPI00214A5DE0|nr:hypothetical protein [Cellulosimicrobium cellulans]